MRHIKPLIVAAFLIVCTDLHAQNAIVDGVDITSMKAPWTMRLLGNDLDITGVSLRPGDEHASYVMMTSGSSKLNVSVFVERADKCKTSDECRDYVLGLGNPAWGKYQDLKKGRIGDFSYFEFYRPEAMGKPLQMLDMYAQYVGQGYWIDLHISKVLYKPGDHALFDKVINSVSFVPKTGSRNEAFDTQKAIGETAAGAWLGLWDKMMCRDSYATLSSITRADVGESEWMEYCNKVNTLNGPKKSRQPIAAAFTKSLPPKTDRPVAILAYHSSFANRSDVVEIVALMLEKDQKWTVTNYLPR